MTYTVMVRNVARPEKILVMGQIKASGRIAAQKEANEKFLPYVSVGEEQMIVANPSQYKEFWEEAVRKYDEELVSEMSCDF